MQEEQNDKARRHKRFDRREFVRRLSAAIGLLTTAASEGSGSQRQAGKQHRLGRKAKPLSPNPNAQEIVCDVLVVGGSLGGVAAALRAAAMGVRVCLVEESGWIGGQFTYQGACTPDENRYTAVAGSTASYQALRAEIHTYYRTRYRLSRKGEQASQSPRFNPGNCWISRWAFEPKVALTILRRMLARYPNLTLHLHTRVTAAEVRNNRIVRLRAIGPQGQTLQLRAPLILDATDLGDLLPMTGAEHVIGAESRAETGEPDAPLAAHPEWVQAFTFPFALEKRPVGENHTIAPPTDYAALKAKQHYRLLEGGIERMFGEKGWWEYRRILAAENFDDPALRYDITLINTGSNDYKGGILPTNSPQADAATLARARHAALGYVYWLQTEAPRQGSEREKGRRGEREEQGLGGRGKGPGENQITQSPNHPITQRLDTRLPTPDTHHGYPEFKLRADLFDTPDGLPLKPYIRESRRIKARMTVREQDIVTVDGGYRSHQRGARAAFFPDSCGIGWYLLDVHASPNHPHGLYLATKPFQIPFGALIPVRITNLLAASKNLGVTHITNGAYRLQPVEWNIGEAAGALAAFCVQRKRLPSAVHTDPALCRAYQRALLDAGIPLYWWVDMPVSHPAFKAAQIVAMEGLWFEHPFQLNKAQERDPFFTDPRLTFRPNATLTTDEKQAIEQQASHPLNWPAGKLTRAAAAQWLVHHVLKP